MMQRYYFLLENMYRAMIIFWLTCLLGYPRTSAPEPNLVVIVAGYTEPMKHFFDSNPGLKSRFNTFIIFDDYNEEELFEIFEKMCKQDDYELAWEVVEKMKNIFVEKINDDVKNFANGRFVRNVYEDMVMNHARRVEKIINPSLEQLKQFTSEDVPAISRRV